MIKKILFLLLLSSTAIASTTINPNISQLGSTITPSEMAVTSGQIIVGNSSGVGVGVTPSGDVSLSNAGVVTVTGASGTSTFAGEIVQTSGNIKAPLAKAGVYNISLVKATTTDANDSIKIQCGTATCSAANPGFVVIADSTTAGVTQQFKITSDITILLSGATWGNDVIGNLTGRILRTLFINDFGTIRTCVALMGGRDIVLNTDTNSTHASVNLPEEILCNTAVSSASNTVLEFGYFRANFTDSSNVWAIQTGLNDVVTGKSADGLSYPWNPVFRGFSSNPTVTTARATQVGRRYCVEYQNNAPGASNSTAFTITAPVKAKQVESNSLAEVYNNSALAAGGSVITSADSTVLGLQTTASGSWTASNNKSASFSLCFEAGPAASFIE
jgi:hypothetical protein